jgi:glycosyltransferase involved in cell wall biosynthesis
MEAASPDSPWPKKTLRPFERIIPGFWIPFGSARAHVNWALPKPSERDIVVLSTFTSMTGQLLMRRLRNKRWLFWGERLHRNTGLKETIQRALTAPISHASGVVGVGRAAEDDYHRRFPNLAHFSIPYHCELSKFFAIPRRLKTETPVTFLFCGQMIKRKGVDLLLLAFDRLVARGIDARLLLVGREAELSKFLETISPATQSKIHYTGFQDPENLSEIFAMGDIFVLPGRYDGWGVVINQALAAGMPIITTDSVGAGVDLVENGTNGVRIVSENVDQLFNAMEKLSLKRELAHQWGERARERAQGLTPEAGAEKWVRVFEKVSCAT